MNIEIILGILIIVSALCYCIAKYCNFDAMHQPTWKNMFFDYSSYVMLGSLICSVVYCGYYVFITVTELL
jgi:hypothetical protein